MVVFGFWYPHPGHDAAYVLFDGALGNPELACDAGVGAAFGHQGEHFTLTAAEPFQGVIAAAYPDELPHQAGIQRAFVDTVNPYLHQAGSELRETGEAGGYPVFSVVSLRSSRGRPKNLIFASSEKPDLRFSDAIDNDFEIVDNADKVLVYDLPIGPDGLRWRDLQVWWKQTRNLDTDGEAKETLYKRLRDSLPRNSPPQHSLFNLYHQVHGTQVPDLPALLPEVWLHWDPRQYECVARKPY